MDGGKGTVTQLRARSLQGGTRDGAVRLGPGGGGLVVRLALISSLSACLPMRDLGEYTGPGADQRPLPGDTSNVDGAGSDVTAVAAERGGTSLALDADSPPAQPGSGRRDASIPQTSIDAAAVSGQGDAASAEGPTFGDAGAGSDGCGAGERRGPNDRCYAMLTTLLAWDAARLACQDRGGSWDLAVVLSDAEAVFLAENVAVEAWVGASDLGDEGTWVWEPTGQVFWSGDGTTGGAVGDAFTNWNSDEPNGGANSDCVRLLPRTGQFPARNAPWADLECPELRAAVCEGPLS